MKDNLYLKGKSLWIFFIIIAAIMASATPISALYYTQTVILLFIVSFLPLARKLLLKKTLLKLKPIVVTAAIFLLIIITILFNRDSDVSYYIGIIMQFFAAWLITELYDENTYINAYIKIFVVISVYSTILTLLFNLNKALLDYLPYVFMDDSKIASWRSLGFTYNIWDIYARFSLVRNSACFREPGVWGSYVILALLYKINIIKSNDNTAGSNNLSKKDIIELVVLIIGALTSVSTSTYISLVLCLLIFFIGKKISKKQISVLCIIVILISIMLFRYQGILFDKLNANSTSYISFLERTQGISNSIYCWIQSPLFGVGYTNYFKIVTEGVNTFSFLFILGEFGIFLFGLLFYMMCSSISKLNFTCFSKFCVFGIYLIILNSQNIMLTPVVVIFFYNSLKGRRAK